MSSVVSSVVTYRMDGWPYEILLLFQKYFKKAAEVTLVCRDGSEKCMARILMNSRFGFDKVTTFRREQTIEVDFCDIVDLKLVLLFLHGFEIKVSPQAARHVEDLLTAFGADYIKATIRHDYEDKPEFALQEPCGIVQCKPKSE